MTFSTQPRVETDETEAPERYAGPGLRSFSTQPRVETDETMTGEELELMLNYFQYSTTSRNR